MGSSRTEVVGSLVGARGGPEEPALASEDAQQRLSLAMDRYAEGDLEAFDEVYRHVSPIVYGYLLQLVRDTASADDLFQLTFTKVHQARRVWNRGARVLPWVITIARNAAYDHFRCKQYTRVSLTKTGELPDMAEPVEGGEPDADLVAALHQHLARLPPHMREAILLTKELGLTNREAATVVGATESAMKLRVHRAYKLLRRELGHVREEP